MKKELSIFLLRYLKIILLLCAITFLLYTISHTKGYKLNQKKRHILEYYSKPGKIKSNYMANPQEFVSIGDDNIYSNNYIIGDYTADNLYLEDESIVTQEEDSDELLDTYTPNTYTKNDLNQDSKETTKIVVNEEIIKSKLFSSTMGRSEITPFYQKATKSFDKEDITITTLVTSNRIRLLSRLATRYKGPISAAIHININEPKEQIFEKLQNLFNENSDMKKYVDVHLIVDKYNRQFNMWRNVAKLYSRTDYVLMLDIDFYICTDFRSTIRNNTEIMNLLRSGKGAFVIPAFEYISRSNGQDFNTFPKSKQELLNLINTNKKIDVFHRTWKKGHFATNYKKWYRSSSVYKVTKYNHFYEPYVIFKKETSPWCDERFIGYGANKAACLYEMYLSGISYYVLPNDFIIHQDHKYPERTRKKERLFNKKMYANYREEVCLRYARKFVADGIWNYSLSKNLKKECQRIRGFKNIIKNINK